MYIREGAVSGHTNLTLENNLTVFSLRYDGLFFLRGAFLSKGCVIIGGARCNTVQVGMNEK